MLPCCNQGLAEQRLAADITYIEPRGRHGHASLAPSVLRRHWMVQQRAQVGQSGNGEDYIFSVAVAACGSGRKGALCCSSRQSIDHLSTSRQL